MIAVILTALAVLCFALAALAVPVGTVNLIATGLALFAAAHLPWSSWRNPPA